MAYVKIWLHGVWGTKNRAPLLEKESIHQKVCSHIVQNAIEKNLFIDCVDGGTDHLHSLMTLNADMSVSKLMQLIKGECSHWVNKNKLVKGYFEWADEYYVESVSERDIDRVRAYIKGQKEHHKKITFLDEYNQFLKQSGLAPRQG